MSEVDISYILHKDAVAVVVRSPISDSSRGKLTTIPIPRPKPRKSPLSSVFLSLHAANTSTTLHSSGIGLAAAKTFASKGMKVFLADKHAEHLAHAYEQVKHVAESAGGEAESMVVDVSKLESIEALKERVMELWGEVAILMNNVRAFPGRVTLSCDLVV